MVGYQHVCVDVNRFGFSTLRKLAKEVAAIAIAEKDRTPVYAAQDDVHRVSGEAIRGRLGMGTAGALGNLCQEDSRNGGLSLFLRELISI